MKVTDKQYTDAMEGTSQAKATKQKSRAQKTASSDRLSSLGETGSAKVKLSGRVQDMKKIREAVNSTPDVDEAKVAKFKSLIANGKYQVDAGKIADKMVDEHAYSELFKADAEE